MTIEVKSGQSIFDVALICYQDASMVYTLIESNPQIQNINSDLTGMILTYVPSVPIQKESLQTLVQTNKNASISSSQSVFDIALQYYGDASLALKIIKDNGLDSLLSDPTGITLNYTPSKMSIPIYFLNNGIQIATKYFIAPIKYRITQSLTFRTTMSGDMRITQ